MPTLAEFLQLVSARRGHFLLESGYHGALWLDLDALFAQPRRIEPFVDALAERIRPRTVSAVCGPLLGGAFLAQLVAQKLDVEFCFTEKSMSRYVLPPAYRSRVVDQRIAIVDDVMSAGSSLRATFDELRAHGAVPVVAGALLILGTIGADSFASMNIAVEAVARDAYEFFPPDDCPMCAAGMPITS